MKKNENLARAAVVYHPVTMVSFQAWKTHYEVELRAMYEVLIQRYPNIQEQYESFCRLLWETRKDDVLY